MNGQRTFLISAIKVKTKARAINEAVLSRKTYVPAIARRAEHSDFIITRCTFSSSRTEDSEQREFVQGPPEDHLESSFSRV